MKIVPNELPEIDLGYSIAFVGQCPGTTEADHGRPMVGPSGDLLFHFANSAKITRSACLVANICQVVPPNGQISRFAWDSWQIQSGLEQLKKDIQKVDPNLVVLLGETALKAAGVNLNTRKGGVSVSQYRGTLFMCQDLESPFYGRKCLATFNPAAPSVLQTFKDAPLFQFDMKRARAEAESPDLSLPKRNLQTNLSPDEIIAYLDALRPEQYVSIDIEGGVTQGISCIGFSTSPDHAVVLSFRDLSLDQAARCWAAVARVLGNPEIPKILQNGLYDNYVLTYLMGCPISNIYWDTMLGGWELYPELKKGLGTQVSIYTRQPYYKGDIKTHSWEVFLRYNALDACCTYEIFKVQQQEMSAEQLQHFRFNMNLLPAALYMSVRGIRINQESLKEELQLVTNDMDAIKYRIDQMAGGPLNPNSPKAMTEFLYGRMRFEKQYVIERGRKTNKTTADKGALLKLFKKYDNEIIYDLLLWKRLEGYRKQLAATTDPDGRMRCSLNPVGTVTGRFSCSKPPQDTGINQQTAMKKVRRHFIADEGQYMWAIDLEGADGWTVAAHCARLGDSTMLDDYLAGIKPAQVIACMHTYGPDVATLPQPELKALIQRTVAELKTPESDRWSWLYYTCKRAQHASNYLTGPRKMSAVITEDSWKYLDEPVYIAEKDCKYLQSLYLNHRYKAIKKWQAWVTAQIKATGKLSSASGHVRTFFGRRWDHKTIQDATAHEPQHNTAYATNLALSNLWSDPDNRTDSGSLIIEPLLQVHDELVGQFPIDQLNRSINKLRQYFRNPIHIADQDITIPFEGGYGFNWQQAGGSDSSNPRLGSI